MHLGGPGSQERSALELGSCSLPREHPCCCPEPGSAPCRPAAGGGGGSDPAPSARKWGRGGLGQRARGGAPGILVGREGAFTSREGQWGLHGGFHRLGPLKHSGVHMSQGKRGRCSVECSSPAFSWFSFGPVFTTFGHLIHEDFCPICSLEQ